MIDLVAKTLGNYQVLLRLHSDGLTALFKAHDIRLGRNVALQVISPEISQRPGFAAKVKEYAKVLAKLNHANIGSLLECDVFQDAVCLIYDFEPREILRSKFHQKMSWSQASKLMIPVAQALDSAHTMGVLHGHLTPANIAIATDGTPYLFDFGIDLLIQQEMIESTPGHWMGVGMNSLQPLEKNLGRKIDTRADIYSFGAIFYGLLTDERPFPGETPIVELQEQYREDAFLPEPLQKELSKVEQMILLKMLERDPQDRFQDMGHLCTLLTRMALRLPVSARAVQDRKWAPKKTRRWQPYALGGALAVALLLTVGFFAKDRWLPAANLASPTVTPAAVVAAGPTRTVEPSRPVATATPGPETLATVATEEATVQAPHLPYLENTPLPGVSATLDVKNVGQLVTLGRLGMGIFKDVAWSSTGDRVALATSAGLFFLDTQDYEVVEAADLSAAIVAIAYSPDGVSLAAGDVDGLIRIWNTQEQSVAANLSGCSGNITRLEYSPDGQYLAAGFDGKNACIWSAVDGQVRRAFADFPQGVLAFTFTPDGQSFVTASSEEEIAWWNLADGSLTALRKSMPYLENLTISADGLNVIAIDRNAHLWGWSLLDENKRDLGAPLGVGHYDIQVSPDGKYLAAGDVNGNTIVLDNEGTKIWAAEKIESAKRMASGYDFSPQITFSPDSKYLLAGSWDGSLRVWMLETGLEVSPEKKYFTAYDRIQLSDDNQYLAVQTDGGEVKVWNLTQQRLLYTLLGTLTEGAPFSPDNRYLAIRNPDADVEIFDLRDGSSFIKLTGGSRIQSIVYSNQENLILAGSKEDLHVWSTATWQEIELQMSYSRLGCKDFNNANGGLIGIVSLTNNLQFKESMDTDLCTESITGWMGFFSWNSLSKLAAAGGPGKLAIWHYPAGPNDEVTEIQAARGVSYSAGEFSPTGSFLLTATSDHAILAFDSSGNPLGTFFGHSGTINDLQLTKDGRYLVTTSADGTIRIWGLQ